VISKLADIEALAATLPARHIYGEDGTLYLSRYRLHGWIPDAQTETPCSVYLHRIHRADLDDALHSHPWAWSQTMCLSGGYIEERGLLMDDGSLVREPNRELFLGRSNFMGPNDLHRIATLRPNTWTLFFVGPKRQSWGFFVEGRGLVPWRERLAERGLVPDYAPTEREQALAMVAAK
jgi:hypothetical protein